MDRKRKRQALFVSDETYAIVLKLQEMALEEGKPLNKGEIITRLLEHDPIVLRYFNRLNEEH